MKKLLSVVILAGFAVGCEEPVMPPKQMGPAIVVPTAEVQDAINKAAPKGGEAKPDAPKEDAPKADAPKAEPEKKAEGDVSKDAPPPASAEEAGSTKK